MFLARRSSVLAAHTPFSPKHNPRTWKSATAIGSSGSALEASMRVTVPSAVFATQAAPAPTVTSVGWVPTGIGSPTELSDLGSKRVTVSLARLVTQTAPSPTAIPPASAILSGARRAANRRPDRATAHGVELDHPRPAVVGNPRASCADRHPEGRPADVDRHSGMLVGQGRPGISAARAA